MLYNYNFDLPLQYLEYDSLSSILKDDLELNGTILIIFIILIIIIYYIINILLYILK